MNTIIEWVKQNPQTNVPILVAVIGMGSAIIGSFFSIIIFPHLKHLIELITNALQNMLARHAFQNTYLRYLINRFRRLPLLPTTLVPIANRPSQELDSLYIEIELASRGTSQPMEVGTFLRQSRLAVVLGHPGAGKTTMMQYLALLLARALRNQARDSGANDVSEERRRIVEARRYVKDVLKFDDYPLPIPVFLSRMKLLPTTDDRSILDSIQGDLASISGSWDLPKGFLQRYVDAGRCVFLFDAFDELGSKEARDAIARRIGELAAAVPSGNRFVVTSRIVGYDGQLSPFGFQSVTIQPLSLAHIKLLVTKWYAVLGDPDLANDLLQAMNTNARLRDLSINPMLLSLIVLVQYIRRVIPEKRHLLYDECIKILVERRYAPRAVQTDFNKLLSDGDAMLVLREIAYTFHLRKSRELSRDFLCHNAIPEILSEMHFSRSVDASPSDVLQNIEERSQLLTERGLDPTGKPLMAFSHLTFQEYLASMHFKERIAVDGESRVSDDLVERYEADPEWWEEVVLLYAAQLEGIRQKRFFERIDRMSAT